MPCDFSSLETLLSSFWLAVLRSIRRTSRTWPIASADILWGEGDPRRCDIATRAAGNLSVNPHIQCSALSLHCPDWHPASVMQGETVAAPAAHGAEGATAPETLRQKDRHHPSVHSEECRTLSSARHTEGASVPAPPRGEAS
ncbi:hypothetical protein CBM2592_B40256 [Cupriavidus taiwanensis]|nr:hypothetical protein CBM2592_B40256 [Cupriavidus taiwanensis]SOY95682.1 hypothetical protein CBM2591_B20253 [Cupriavidus taiwanensis]SOZ74828.1 hypothetical protein CBM2617_B60169 [Cupriavidus taiwanensis]SOZ88428.1 hypothetical protein CBM2618_B50172 [Cupriavidus taiwanensis]SOZ91713.1 hypothetical protein CBM2622_B50169 [Cupriavidus taiwanensis]